MFDTPQNTFVYEERTHSLFVLCFCLCFLLFTSCAFMHYYLPYICWIWAVLAICWNDIWIENIMSENQVKISVFSSVKQGIYSVYSLIRKLSLDALKSFVNHVTMWRHHWHLVTKEINISKIWYCQKNDWQIHEASYVKLL